MIEFNNKMLDKVAVVLHKEGAIRIKRPYHGLTIVGYFDNGYSVHISTCGDTSSSQSDTYYITVFRPTMKSVAEKEVRMSVDFEQLKMIMHEIANKITIQKIENHVKLHCILI